MPICTEKKISCNVSNLVEKLDRPLQVTKWKKKEEGGEWGEEEKESVKSIVSGLWQDVKITPYMVSLPWSKCIKYT